jgi:hypothetical protein
MYPSLMENRGEMLPYFEKTAPKQRRLGLILFYGENRIRLSLIV